MKRQRKLSHFESDGSARMVDVGRKQITRRQAVAEAWVNIGPVIAESLRRRGGLKKGNVLETARSAGITAAKKTADLSPLCHPLLMNVIETDARLHGDRIHIVSRVVGEGRTGVEMEALTAASVAALTVYDMVKSAGKGIEIGPIRLLEKKGGASGCWKRKEHGNGTG